MFSTYIIVCVPDVRMMDENFLMWVGCSSDKSSLQWNYWQDLFIIVSLTHSFSLLPFLMASQEKVFPKC